MAGETGRRRALREYIQQDSDPPQQQGDTGRFLVVPDGRVGYIPPEQHLCRHHSGLKADIRHLLDDLDDVRAQQRDVKERLTKLELLPWRVVAAAVGGGGGVAGVVELLRLLVGGG